MPLPHNLFDYCSIRKSNFIEKYLVVKRKISFAYKADILLTKLIIRGGGIVLIYIKPALARLKKRLLGSNSRMKVLAEDFAKLNAPFWRSEEPSKKEGKILYFTRQFYPYTVVNVMPFLKYLAKKHSKKIIIASEPGICDENAMRVYASYGIDGHIIVGRVPFYMQIYFLFWALKFWVLRKSGDDVLKLSYHGVPFGEEAYDAIIRKNANLYTVERVTLRYAYDIMRCLFHMYAAEDIFKNHGYDIFVFTDCDYELNGYPKMAMKYKLSIWQAGGAVITEHRETRYKVFHGSFITKDEYYKMKEEVPAEDIDCFLDKHFSGTNNAYLDRTAYSGKKEYDKVDLYKKLGVNHVKRKNVLVAAHAFSDTPHYGVNMLYRDYFIWLLETVKLLSKNDDVNVFVKEHPSAYYYGEEGSVSYYISKNHYSNVYVLPDDFSTISVFSIMDAIVTCQGTIGLEATIWGLPVFTASQGYYSGFGIGHSSSTIDEYEYKMLHITDYASPDLDTIEKAKLLLYIVLNGRKAGIHELMDSKVLAKSWMDSRVVEYQLEAANAYLENGVDSRGKMYYEGFPVIKIQKDY